jgi:RNA recognition motif-containing protein
MLAISLAIILPILLRKRKDDMSKKLFVGSLSWNTDDHGLRDAFAPHGEVTEATVIANRDTGRSRGFGFVTFADDEAADKAVAALDFIYE